MSQLAAVVDALALACRGRIWSMIRVRSLEIVAASPAACEWMRTHALPVRVAQQWPEVAARWREIGRYALEHGTHDGVGVGPAWRPGWVSWRSSRADARHVWTVWTDYDPAPALVARWPAIGAGALRTLVAATGLMSLDTEPSLPIPVSVLARATGRSRRSTRRDLDDLAQLGALSVDGPNVAAPWLREFCASLSSS